MNVQYWLANVWYIIIHAIIYGEYISKTYCWYSISYYTQFELWRECACECTIMLVKWLSHEYNNGRKQTPCAWSYKYPGTLKQHVDDKTVTLSITILYWTWQNIHHNSQINTIMCLWKQFWDSPSFMNLVVEQSVLMLWTRRVQLVNLDMHKLWWWTVHQ